MTEAQSVKVEADVDAEAEVDPNPEIELLRAVARPRLDSAAVDRILEIIARVDWVATIRQAKPHGLLPLLYRHLASLASDTSVVSDSLPEATLGVLRDLFEANRQRNEQLAAELPPVLELLSTAGIRVLTFKGPTLAAEAFGDLAVRQIGDLDLWLAREDALAARQLLVDHGFRSWNTLTKKPEPAVVDFPENEFSFVRDDPPLAVDLHWDLLPGYNFCPFDFHALWRGRQSVEIRGHGVPMPGNEDLLRILCVHGCKHHWTRLLWIADVAAVAAQPDLDWRRLLTDASRQGSRRMVRLGLFLACEVSKASLPSEVAQEIAEDPEIAPLAAPILEGFYQPTFRKVRRVEPRIYSRMRERRRDRARIVAYQFRRVLHHALAANDKDRAFVRLPRWLSFLYVLVRPVRLLSRHGLKPLAPLRQMLKHMLRS